MGKALAPHRFRDALEPFDVRDLAVGDAEPPEPLSLVGTRPKRRIARPEPAYLTVGTPIPDGLQVGQGERLGQSRGLLIDLGGAGFPGALSDGAEQLVEGIAEELHALGEQLVGDLLQRDAGVRQRRERVERSFQVLPEAGTRPSVIAERRERGRGHRVHGVGADELLHVAHVAIARVLGPRAGPEQTLCLRTAARQRAPTRAVEQLAISLVGQLRVRNRHFALQAAQQRPLPGVGRAAEPLGDERVDGRVDATDEEAGHAGNAFERAVARGPLFQSCEIRVSDLLVGLHGRTATSR